MFDRAANSQIIGGRIVARQRIGLLLVGRAVEQLKTEVHLRQHAELAETRNANLGAGARLRRRGGEPELRLRRNLDRGAVGKRLMSLPPQWARCLSAGKMPPRTRENKLDRTALMVDVRFMTRL